MNPECVPATTVDTMNSFSDEAEERGKLSPK